MPLDAAGFVTTVDRSDPFTNLGYEPIGEHRAQSWRRFMINDFVQKGAEHRRFIASGRVGWRATQVMSMEFFRCTGLFEKAPKDVRNMVNTIAAAHPHVKAEIQWFDTDPILYLDDDDQRYCMAIWHLKIVRAIAANAPLSRLQKGLRQLVATV